MPLLFSLTQCGLSDLKAGEVCQKQAEAVPEKPATSRLFNAHRNPPTSTSPRNYWAHPVLSVSGDPRKTRKIRRQGVGQSVGWNVWVG